MNTIIEFDLQFKIFTLVDTTKSYVILNESMNKLLSVSESIVLMRYAHSTKLVSTIQPSNMFVYTSRSHTPKIAKSKHSEIK